MLTGRWFHRNYDIILSQVAEGDSVLDLGCGDGALLADLVRDRRIRPLGLEISEEAVIACAAKGIPVIQMDIDQGLAGFRSSSWDVVVLNRTLQVLKRPDVVLDEMLRVGRKAIVGFPNFAHWRHRLQVLLRGRMPVSEVLPYPWYASPNIHLCTVADFRDFVRSRGYRVLDAFFLDGRRAGALIAAFPNLLASEAVFVLARKGRR